MTYRLYQISFGSEPPHFVYYGITNKNILDRLKSHVKAPTNYNLAFFFNQKDMPYKIEELMTFKTEKEARRQEAVIILKCHQNLESRPYLMNIFAGGTKLEPSMNHKDKLAYWANKKFTPKKYKVVAADMTKIVRCSKCHKHKPATEFYRDRTRFNGLHSRCKACATAVQIGIRAAYRNRNEDRIGELKVGTKRCAKCKEVLPRNEFNIYLESPDGLYSQCIHCRKSGGRRAPLKPKQCTRCQEVKPPTEFRISRQKDIDLHAICNTCLQEVNESSAESFCTYCQTVLPIERFGKNKFQCRDCGAHESKKRYQRLKQRAITNISEKLCTKCRKVKPNTDFHKHKGRLDGLYPYCKVCRNKIQNTWRQQRKIKQNQIQIP